MSDGKVVILLRKMTEVPIDLPSSLHLDRLAPMKFLLAAWLLLCSSAAFAAYVEIVVDAELPTPAKPALDDLDAALQSNGHAPARRNALSHDNTASAVVAGIAGSSPIVDRLLKEHRIELPAAEESLCIRRLKAGQRDVLLLAGRDARGLSYALLEAARAIGLSPPGSDPFRSVPEALEAPYLRVRSMTIHPCNADVERSWYYDEAFWRDYFARLARCRYNNFTLTFSDQTNYWNPMYAWHVEVPEYPQVRVEGLTAADRGRNLLMLRRIAELARERGLDFTLGIWMQSPVPEYSAPVRVRDLPEGLAAAPYAASALKKLLIECPAITGIQFRMNAEAGVPEEQQTDFYRPLFAAIRDCGRPVRLDLRYKGLRPETTKAARETGLDVTVSTKFWAEHFGLPYHPTVADSHYRESRYSFGTMLARPRDYRVTYRLWTVGSQRLLLWGDPEYAARFAEACRLGGGEGFEVFAPLTNKGHGDDPGDWPIFANKTDEYYTWEHQRYWFFELVFGRVGYNPQCDPEAWRREFRSRFGKAAGDVETAYCHASRILALITAARLPSASEWRWWPEMETGGRLAEYMHIQPADTAQFYAICSWKRTPQWAWDEWDATIPGYVEDALAGKVGGKTTPQQISREWIEHAEHVERALSAAARTVGSPSAEFRATQIDLGVLAALGRYHAEKTAAATQLALFERDADPARPVLALQNARRAAEAWERIVQLTDGFYSDNLVFGIAPGSSRSRMGLHHGGHWKDRLPQVLDNVKQLEQLAAKQDNGGPVKRVYPGETERKPAAKVIHQPPQSMTAGESCAIEVRVDGAAANLHVKLHYRPLDQTANWKQMPMDATGGAYQVVLPGNAISARFDLQYYFELVDDGGGWLWPSRQAGAPYFVVPVGH